MRLEWMCGTLMFALAAGRSTPGAPVFTVLQGQNNCYGDPAECWFRGRFADYASCEGVCAADPACRSFTW
eukprot:gene10248-9055_t